MVVRYHRNESRQSNCDMRQIEFLVSEDKVLVTYHTDKASIAASTREFLKPHNWDEKGATLSWSRDMHSTYQVSVSHLQRIQNYAARVILRLPKSSSITIHLKSLHSLPVGKKHLQNSLFVLPLPQQYYTIICHWHAA